MNNEVWKPYPEFSFIEVSSIGRVRTLDRVVTCGNGMRLVKGRILKQWRTKKGYMFVSFKVNGTLINKRVHRLVAQTFLPNPKNWPQVNHKDNNPANNCVSNLEWCTGEYNIEYREKHGKALNQPVFAIDLKTLEVSRFPSQIEASRVLGTNDGSISQVIAGKRNHTGGYWFVNADSNAVENVRAKFGNEIAGKVRQLVKDKELQLA